MAFRVGSTSWLGAVWIVSSWMVGCCPCGSGSKPPTTEPTGPASAPKAPVAQPPRPPEQGECTGDNADSELPCKLPDSRWGWCKKGRCKDVCPAGFSYSHLDTACHQGCSPSCKNCMDEACLDDATTRPMLED